MHITKSNSPTSSKTFPISLCNAINLKFLYFSSSEIESIPDEIEKLVNLEHFSMSDTGLKLLPETISNLSNLEAIIFCRNKIHALPESFGNLKNLRYLYLVDNLIEDVPESLKRAYKLVELKLDSNPIKKFSESMASMEFVEELSLMYCGMESISDSIEGLKYLNRLNLSNNKLTELPEAFGCIENLRILNLSDNLLERLPSSFSKLESLESLNLRGNKFESLPSVVVRLENKDNNISVDYKNNPFSASIKYRSERFTRVWHNTPKQLRELIKIYLSSFNIFYKEKTKNEIEFNVTNDDESLSFEIVPDEHNDPDVVEELLNEYFEILKNKLKEGTTTGRVIPNSSADSPTMFAEIQASYFAQNVNHVRNSIQGYVSAPDIYASVSGRLTEMENEYNDTVGRMTEMSRIIREQKDYTIKIETTNSIYKEEIDHRRIEAITRAKQPLAINVSQQTQVNINQQVGVDFEKVRELLHPFLNEFQRQTASDIQKEIDQVIIKPEVTPEEKKVLGNRLKRFLDNVSGTLGSGKKVVENASVFVKYFDKLKDFSLNVLHNPEVQQALETLQKALDITTS